MAVVEEVKIKITSDTSELKSTKQELVEMGAVTESSAKQYDKLTESANKTATAVKSIGKEGSVELDKIGNSADNVGKKFNETSKSSDKLKNGFKSQRQEIKESRLELERLIKKYGENSTQVIQQQARLGALTDSYIDLNRQIRLLNPEDKIRAFQNFGSGVFSAIQVATGALQAFGASSEELDKAIYRISGAVSALYGLTSFIQLKEQFQDIGVVLRATGSASELVSNGLEVASESAGDLATTATDVVTSTKDAVKSVKDLNDGAKVIADTTKDASKAIAAQTVAENVNTEAKVVNNTVTATGDKVTKSATASTIAFTRALLASPLGIIAAAIGAVIGGLYLYEKATKASREENERALKIEAALLTARGEQEKAELALAMAQGKAASTAQARIDTEKELKDQLSALYEETDYVTVLGKVEEIEEKKRKGRWVERGKAIQDLENNLRIANEKGNKNLADQLQIELNFQKERLQIEEAPLLQKAKIKEAEEKIKRAFIAKSALLDKQDADDKKANDEKAAAEEERRLAEAKQKREEYLQGLLNQLEEEKKIRQDAIDLKRTKGEDEKVLLEDQLKSIELEKESLANISKQANGTRFKGEIQSRINQLTRDELKLRAELGNLNVQQELKRIEQVQRNRENELTLLREIGTKESDIITKRIDGIDVDVESLKLLKDNVSNLKDKADIDQKINDLLFQRQILQVQFNKATEGENEAFYQQTIDAIDKQLERTKAANELTAKSNEDLAEKNLKSEIQAIETKIAINKKANKDITDLELQLAALRKKLNKEDLDSEEETRQKKADIIDKTFELSKGFSEEIFQLTNDLNQQSTDEYIKQLEDQKEKGIITEEQYQNKIKEIKKKQALADKNQAIFEASMGLAQAVIQALNAKPPVSFASVAIASALAAANLARIIATPLPKFKEGTLSVPGTYIGEDSVMAMLEPDEAVIPRDINKKYRPAIRAIYNQTISPKLLNDFVSKKITSDEKNINIGFPTSITANVDSYQLSKALSKNKSVEVSNAHIIGSVIADELSNKINLRQII